MPLYSRRASIYSLAGDSATRDVGSLVCGTDCDAVHPTGNHSMVLSDRTIKELIGHGRIGIKPFDGHSVQPSSVDLRLDFRFRVFRSTRHSHIDPRVDQADLTELVTLGPDEPFVLQPGQFCLGNTLEQISLPDDIVGRLEGKSSLGRLGLVIHSTAGYVDPGFRGHLTLELSNAAPLPILLFPTMKIGQLSFLQMSTPADHPYGTGPLGSKYQGQDEPTASRIHLDFARDHQG